MDFDLEKFYKFLAADEKLIDSIDFCNGLRLFIAKNPFECIISSICSANNSIARWTKSVDKIKSNWGNRFEFDDGTFYDFPTPNQFLDFFETPIEEADADGHCYEIGCYNRNLKSCGVGYRAPYMKKASQMLIDEIDLNEIFKMDYEEAFDIVLDMPGVGPKVADCILLYGFCCMDSDSKRLFRLMYGSKGLFHISTLMEKRFQQRIQGNLAWNTLVIMLDMPSFISSIMPVNPV